MLRRMHTGKPNDECYSVMWKAPNGNYQIVGVRDNERDKFYSFNTNSSELIDLIRDLNVKEQFRSGHYNNITQSFEKIIRESEDRYLELWYKNQELEEEIQKLKDKKYNINIKI